ncbi:MAG: haloacid dehalogenase type II [Acidiferrobacterales bacterium]
MSPDVKALVFDVFGTLVDWRTPIINELRKLGETKDVMADWAAFTDAWKQVYRIGMDKVNRREIPWTNVDVIYRERLDQLLPQYGLGELNEDERDQLNCAWCRPQAWPDVVSGLARLKTRYVVATLSNGNFAWLVAIAKHCDLPFDCILTAENAQCYKPEPAVYRMAIELLAEPPECILMVASHNYDLAAARAQGLRTAFFPRRENGPAQTSDQCPEQDWDFVVSDLEALAQTLGC